MMWKFAKNRLNDNAEESKYVFCIRNIHRHRLKKNAFSRAVVMDVLE